MPHVLPLWAFFAINTPLCAFAFWRGDREVRIATAYLALNPVLYIAIPVGHDPGFEMAWEALDVLVFFSLAFRSSRYWTLVMASASLVNFVTTTMLFWGISPWAVGIGILMWDGVYMVTLVAAACGTEMDGWSGGSVHSRVRPVSTPARRKCEPSAPVEVRIG